ncbi:MAG: ACT domain-containing protein [Oscillospiraceae bacterium]
MAYIIKYIKKLSHNGRALEEICKKDIENGYKVRLFFDELPSEKLEIPTVECIACAFAGLAAVKAAVALYAEKCQFYFERGGIFSIDPKKYSYGKKIPKLDYDEAMELTTAGYHFLGEEVLEYAKRHSVRLEVLSIEDDVPTTIKEVFGLDGMLIKSVIKDPNIVVITLTEVPDKKGMSYHIFKTLSEGNIFVDSIMLPAANHSQQDISFLVKSGDKALVEKVLQENRSRLEFKDIIVNDNVAKISVIGSGIQTQYGVAAKFLEVLYNNDINVMMIFTTEIKISVVVENSKADLAVHEIHKAFID